MTQTSADGNDFKDKGVRTLANQTPEVDFYASDGSLQKEKNIEFGARTN